MRSKVTRDECAVIALDGVSREYVGHDGGGAGAGFDATFSIVAGEWVAMTGPSGSGKSHAGESAGVPGPAYMRGS